ncbi:hypothetical protein G7Y89_g14412 [Cudoniella acicularis]|uniref:Uncharacterized protein n=1 Tax=Cudoniella acicularis TaxID=354080 RepID=A0A8H4R208_9HELO|nr:hypothetical protein G7Y89_g14412 [Cudoniella acicularis]
MEGTFGDPANHGIIPWYLFNTTDASTYILDYLTSGAANISRTNGTTSGSILYNWAEVCQNPKAVFLTATAFVPCLLYPNVTRNVDNGTLPANLSAIGFSSNEKASVFTSRIPTCLAAYRASQSDYAIRNDGICDTEFETTTFFDQNFLLLVSVDGMLPVVATLYTLMAFGKSTIKVVGGTWPYACGSYGPSSFCAGIGLNKVYGSHSTPFLIIMIIMDIITALMVLWELLNDTQFLKSKDQISLWSKGTELVARWITPRKNRPPGFEGAGLDVFNRRLRCIRVTAGAVFHLVVVVPCILRCLGAEIYVFVEIFKSPYVYLKDWGFGQIV